MSVEAFPLCWPVGRKRRQTPQRARFADIPFGKARDYLLHEIDLLGATRPVLSTNIPLRQDGLPYANRNQPQDKGVAVYFTIKNRPMVFACDEWDRIEHNVLAIAKTIEALRGIERWGSGDMVERAFTGFTALPAPTVNRHWREVLGFHMRGTVPDDNAVTRAQLKGARDILAQVNHPDRGGNATVMAEINRAYEEALKEVDG